MRSFCSVFLLVCMSACTQDAPPQTKQPSNAAVVLNSENAAVSEAELQKFRLELLGLKRRISILESGEATVSTVEEGYDVARTKFGPFTVSAQGATPYLDGYKVKLRIGNLTSANFNGAKLKLGWGPPFDANKIDDWSKDQKNKQIDITNKLISGSFTDVEVSLTPAKPEEIKSIEVGFELNQLQLRTAR